ncbi:MAG: MBL fold metallo-hydrolase [Clostridia bacterium]|nr:MBL fold metallo-hydrolase [Clostridia bacterium]
MKILFLRSGPLRVNTYFLVNEETGKAICIDGGENYKLVKRTEEENGFKINYLLLTHAHFDHAGNGAKLQADGAKVVISEKDAEKLLNDDNLAIYFGRDFQPFKADITVNGGEELELNGIKVKVIATAGHTDGSLSFLVDDMLFTGDTLFFESVGRTDFKTGNRAALINSVKTLFALDGDYKVFPGHEDFTTLSHEREYNVFKDVEI